MLQSAKLMGTAFKGDWTSNDWLQHCCRRTGKRSLESSGERPREECQRRDVQRHSEAVLALAPLFPSSRTETALSFLPAALLQKLFLSVPGCRSTCLTARWLTRSSVRSRATLPLIPSCARLVAYCSSLRDLVVPFDGRSDESCERNDTHNTNTHRPLAVAHC